MANARVHATTGERPDQRLMLERTALLPLPSSGVVLSASPGPRSQPVPVESLQHPLSVYDSLLGVAA